MENCYGLVPWEKRKDVPDWAREISLVAAIHCQHWTGYVFNDYEQVLENLKKYAVRLRGGVYWPICPVGKGAITGNTEIILPTSGWEEKKVS